MAVHGFREEAEAEAARCDGCSELQQVAGSIICGGSSGLVAIDRRAQGDPAGANKLVAAVAAAIVVVCPAAAAAANDALPPPTAEEIDRWPSVR